MLFVVGIRGRHLRRSGTVLVLVVIVDDFIEAGEILELGVSVRVGCGV